MSLGARATKGGAKGKETKQEKGKTTEKPQPKEKTKPQATTEQLRMANMIDRPGEDVSDVRRKVAELMEMTRRTEEEVCSALHDTDHDMDAACNLLLEESQRIQGEWRTNEKKRKKPPAATGNGEVERERDRDQPRSRSGPRPRRGEGEGGRGRANGRGRGGGRGGRGGGRGARRGAGRGPSSRTDNDWAHTNDMGGTDSFPTTEDWDNEEWSGSLSDTKVFTPSSSANVTADVDAAAQPPAEDWDNPTEVNGPTEHIPTFTYHNTQQHHHPSILEQLAGQPATTPAPPPKSDAPPVDTYHTNAHHQPMGMSGSLSAAQSQYLTQLTQQAQRHDNSVYTSNYGVYGSTDLSTQRKTQRVRVPPPSKIPSSAVEMPGGAEGGGGMFLDVQFGALEPDALHDQPPAPQPKQPTSQAESQPPPTNHEPAPDTNNSYSNSNSMLNESLSVVDATPASQPVTSDTTVTNNTSSLDKLSASMKQLGVSTVSGVSVSAVSGVAAGGAGGGAAGGTSADAASQPQQHHHYAHHRPKTVGQQNVYAAHHAVTHHPPVYGANVYAPQVNSTNASLTGASAMTATAYPSSVTLTQYQPMINSYQQTSSSGGVYGGSALYTAAPYTPAAYQPAPQPTKPHKDAQYDSSVAASNSLTSTSTTQTTTAKVATTTVSGAVNSGAASSASGTAAGGAGAGAGAGAGGYAGGALYGGAYAYDETQLMRGTLPHHMGGYYEAVSYGAREGTFGLGAGERFGRTDAASPQQVPAALPPGYAYFYQPPPTTYQYGVYPTYGGGSNVGGVGVSGGGKVSAYSQQQQPPYDAQDSYKPGGPYTANANKTAGGASADLTNAMYAKTHVALNKVNSYEKAGFHSGTPPPFGAGSHLYIPAPPHHHPHHHQQHQMDGRMNSSHNRRESGSAGRASAKPANSKPAYSQSYWAPN